MPNLNENLKLYSVNKPSLGGMNTFDDPKDIADVESADILNMVFDGGMIFPRSGSILYAGKPSGEAAQPFQFLIATGSDGVDYMIANYGINFYLWDTINGQWIKLNQIFSPSSVENYYGSANFNNGTIDDRFFFGNGVDDTMKWPMAVNSLSIAAVAADTSITLNDSTHFPQSFFVGNPTITIASPGVVTVANHGLSINDIVSFTTDGALPTGIVSGTRYFVIAGGFTANTFEISLTQGGAAINTAGAQSGTHQLFTHTLPLIIVNAGTVINKKYNNNTSNVLTLTTAIGSNVPAGSTVTMPIIDMDNMPKGRVLITFQTSRLVLANYVGHENTMNTSYFGEPESFLIDNTVNTAVISTINKGKGGIIGLDDFGEYLAVEKQDIILRYDLVGSADGSSFQPQSDPIISGDNIGPVVQSTKLNYMNTLYYPTQTQGIISFSPNVTGSQTSSGLNILSQKIQNYVTQVLSFINGRTCGFNQKLFWANAVPIINGLPATINNGIIMYDIIRGVWTRFNNWNAADIKPVNNVLYYLSLNDGGVYQCFVDYQDAIGVNPLAYDVAFLTKRFDLGQPSTLQREQYIYVQGAISLTTTFYVDVLYNENGTLGKQTYEIDARNSNIVQNLLVGGLAAYPFGIPLLGGFNLGTMQNATQPAVFRCYLELSQAFRPNNIQLRFYSTQLGAYWGINNYTIMNLPEQSIPTQMVLSPATTPPIVL